MKVLDDFWDVPFPHITVEGKVVDSNMYGMSSFTGKLSAIWSIILEVG